jgi:hypothetical protein
MSDNCADNCTDNCQTTVLTSTCAGIVQGAEKRVPDVLRGTSYVTTDPSVADFFYVPAHLYCMQGMWACTEVQNRPEALVADFFYVPAHLYCMQGMWGCKEVPKSDQECSRGLVEVVKLWGNAPRLQLTTVSV